MSNLPKDPPSGLLMSMAIRFDHGLGLPGYYDALPIQQGLTHSQRLEATLVTMRQLYEEVAGFGFYNPEREGEYASLTARSPEGSESESRKTDKAVEHLWRKHKPTEPGAYWVRNWITEYRDHAALVIVTRRDDDLYCNLGNRNTDVADGSDPLASYSDEFEWCGPLLPHIV